MTDISSIPCRSAFLDQNLLDITIELCRKYKITKFVETGSYHGGSAKIVSRYIREIHTIENNPDLFKIAKENLKNSPNVNLHFGSSPDVLSQILFESENNIFLFLDAHWDMYWPLLDEFKVLKDKNIKPIIAIHDFFVPPDGKFGYDVHPGDGTILNFEYIKNSIEEIYDGQYEYFYNTECSDIYSGVIFICPKRTINLTKEKILTEEEKHYSYPIKVLTDDDKNFLDQSKVSGNIFFGQKELNHPKFWRNEKFKLPFNEFSIREYKDVCFEVMSSNSSYFGEGDRVKVVSENKANLSVNKVFPALNFMGYLWQHFVQDTLPILYFGREFLQRNPDIVILLYSGISEDIVNYFFNLFEISNPIKYVSYEGCVISTNHLYNFESNVQIPTYWWNNFFYEGIHKLVNQSYKQEKKNVIYTKRLYRRTISNEDQLKDTLINFCLRNNLNFIEFEAEKYTIEERADIFRNAHTVISPHGGANYHLIFCPKGIKFIEYTFIDCLYTLYNIASSLELNYYVVPNYGTNETPSIEIDIHKLNMLLDL